jgi:hypothetical protein
VLPTPQRQKTSQPTVYLSSQSGQQTPSSIQDDDIISQLLSQQGRGLFPSSSPSPASLAEEIIKSTTSSPLTEPRSSIFVTQTSNVKTPQSPGRITVEDLGEVQDNSGTSLPVVHLPTPKGQRPLTQSEFQALIDAGFKISPVQESPVQTVTSEYYQPTTKRQRSYVTPSPTQRNQVPYQSTQKNSQQGKENVHVSSLGAERLQPRGQVNRYQLQETKPRREEEDGVQYVRNPETENIRQDVQVTRIQVVTDKPRSEEIIHLIQIPATSQVPEIQQSGVLTKYQPASGSKVLHTQIHRLRDETEGVQQQREEARYQPEPQVPSYQTQPDDLPHQTQSLQHGEEPVGRQVPSFHPIIVAELSTTPAPRRRRPRPNTSRAVYRAQPAREQKGNDERYLVSYDSIPEATSFGTRNSRQRSRRPVSEEES